MLAAGVAAGTINTIVGSGSLITFPTLLAIGYPPVLANVSNTVGIWPGAASGAWGYRAELRGQLRRCLLLGGCSAAGAVVGAAVLLVAPAGIFDRVVPVLIGVACLLIGVQPALTRAMEARRSAAGSAEGIPERPATAAVAVFLCGIYGGYFGAAQGVIVLALLGLTINESLQRTNAVKNVLTALANLVAAAFFFCVTHVAWLPAVLIGAGSVVGGQIGARLGRRIPPTALRVAIVVVGTSVAVYLLVRG